MTQNPRVAKIAYLDKHFEEYDSYVIGCSATSSYPANALNDYYGASFYNMIMYGADMKDVEDTVRYMLKNYTVKNLVLNVYIDNGITYDTGESTITHNLHRNVSGASAVEFYGKYLLLNPAYAYAKAASRVKDTYLPQTFDVFDVATGAYDKRARDVERIADMKSYLEAYPVFADYPHWKLTMTETDRCMESVARIRDMCAASGVRLDVVSAPVYGEYLENFNRAEVTDFYVKLADTVPYWDFTISSVSFEPRYFYDGTHFRNAVGYMALARVFGDDTVYVPPDFGVYVTRDNVAEHVETFWSAQALDATAMSAEIPILMYHDVSDAGSSDSVTAENFRAHIAALIGAGYTPVTLDDLSDYVRGGELPEKPVVLTFDDGYLSNYTLAYPILREFSVKATIFVIGSSVGRDTYKDTGIAIHPHFDYAQAREMSESGLVSIQSHTYDMHHWPDYEPDPSRARESVLQLPGESESSYREALLGDLLRAKTDIESATKSPVFALAYPHGEYDTLSQRCAVDAGFTVTLGIGPGKTTIIRGMPQSLLSMNRIAVNDTVSVSELLAAVG
jgi:peptidoglycan/xylan/chitin deacetylase (PgdA/CDA1 family)